MDYGLIVLNPVLSAFQRFWSWSITIYGNSIQVGDVITFTLLVSMFFIVIRFIGDIT